MKKKSLVLTIIIIGIVLLLTGFVQADEMQSELIDLKLISASEVKIGEIMYFDLKVTNDVEFVTVCIQHEEIEDSKALLALITSGSQNAKIDLSNLGTQKLLPGKYYVSGVYLEPDNLEKYVGYSKDPKDEKTKKLDLDIRFTIIDNSEILKSIEMVGEKNVKSTDRIYFDIKTSEEVEHISLGFRNKSTKCFPLGYVKITTDGTPMGLNLGNMSEKVVNGEYYLSDVFVFKKNENKAIHYSNYSKGDDVYYLDALVEFTVKDEEIAESSSIIEKNIEVEVDIPKFELKKFELKNNKVKLGEKIYFDLETVGNVEKIFLSFANDKNKVIEFSIYDLNTQNPYITIPEDFDLGKYELRYIVLRDYEENEVHYEYGTIEKNNFTAEIEIEEKDEKVDDTSEENELVVNKLEKINNENNLEKIEIKNYKDVIIKICVIIVCVVILILIFTKKILSNKKKENREE